MPALGFSANYLPHSKMTAGLFLAQSEDSNSAVIFRFFAWFGRLE
jgi:hypothetical protein